MLEHILEEVIVHLIEYNSQTNLVQFSNQTVEVVEMLDEYPKNWFPLDSRLSELKPLFREKEISETNTRYY